MSARIEQARTEFANLMRQYEILEVKYDVLLAFLIDADNDGLPINKIVPFHSDDGSRNYPSTVCWYDDLIRFRFEHCSSFEDFQTYLKRYGDQVRELGLEEDVIVREDETVEGRWCRNLTMMIYEWVKENIGNDGPDYDNESSLNGAKLAIFHKLNKV